jgi:hypothetical protein
MSAVNATKPFPVATFWEDTSDGTAQRIVLSVRLAHDDFGKRIVSDKTKKHATLQSGVCLATNAPVQTLRMTTVLKVQQEMLVTTKPATDRSSSRGQPTHNQM